VIKIVCVERERERESYCSLVTSMSTVHVMVPSLSLRLSLSLSFLCVSVCDVSFSSLSRSYSRAFSLGFISTTRKDAKRKEQPGNRNLCFLFWRELVDEVMHGERCRSRCVAKLAKLLRSMDARHAAQLMTVRRDNDTRILNLSGQYDSLFCSFLEALQYGSGRAYIDSTFESTARADAK
jgi:hypothetical protein